MSQLYKYGVYNQNPTLSVKNSIHTVEKLSRTQSNYGVLLGLISNSRTQSNACIKTVFPDEENDHLRHILVK